MCVSSVWNSRLGTEIRVYFTAKLSSIVPSDGGGEYVLGLWVAPCKKKARARVKDADKLDLTVKLSSIVASDGGGDVDSDPENDR
jgi:hypothetical protein